MKDLFTSLVTNLHILVISVLLVGLGLGMVQNPAEGTDSVVISFPKPHTTEAKPYVVASTTNGLEVLGAQRR